MSSAFGVFRIIFGLIISGFILYFFIQYGADIIGFQETFHLGKSIKNFEKLSNDVYYSGNPRPFLGFAKAKKFDLLVDVRKPAGILSPSSKLGKMGFSVPTLLSPDKKLFLHRGDLNFGFWKFSMVEAMPEIRIIFNPVASEPETFDFIFNIINTLPDTGEFQAYFSEEKISFRITFSLCDGDDLSKGIERFEFGLELGKKKNSGASYGLCEVAKSKNDRIVIIAGDCSGKEHICIELPSAGIGKIFIKGKEIGYYIYGDEIKDTLSIVAAVIGGEKETIYGMLGENLYEYKNRVFAEEIKLASTLLGKRAELLKKAIELEIARGKISSNSDAFKCKDFYSGFKASLTNIADMDLTKEYYKDSGKMGNLHAKLKEAISVHESLVDCGCDYEM